MRSSNWFRERAAGEVGDHPTLHHASITCSSITSARADGGGCGDAVASDRPDPHPRPVTEESQQYPWAACRRSRPSAPSAPSRGLAARAASPAARRRGRRHWACTGVGAVRVGRRAQSSRPACAVRSPANPSLELLPRTESADLSCRVPSKPVMCSLTTGYVQVVGVIYPQEPRGQFLGSWRYITKSLGPKNELSLVVELGPMRR